MLRQNEKIVTVKNCFGTEYVIETPNRKRVRSVQVIISTGRRWTKLDTALSEEYLVYVKYVIYMKQDNRTSYILMDVPSQYINRIQSDKARKTVANIFRTMYSFLYLMGWYTIKNLDYERANSLVDFLKNSSRYVDSESDSEENLVRDNNTVALYLTRIRSYVRWLGFRNDHPLLRSNIVMFIDKYGNKQAKEKNEISVRQYSNSIIRYHITLDEYRRIREAKCLGCEYYRLLVKCIVDLMFRHGLRIGEVFALTLEDIYTDSNGETCIVIRNRFTKDKFRLAKGCMNVATRFNYTDREYQAFDRGYQVVYLEKDVAKTLFAYMSATHEFLPPRTKADKKVFIKRKKTYKTTVADTVANYIKSNSVRDEMMLSNFRSIDKKNHYLFLNNRFGPLNDAYWNSLLKKVMVDEHIGIDTGRKKFGLNHRFRHGFAMFLLYKMELNVFEVAKLMRHHSVSSLEPYLKLTTEGILELRNRYTSDIYDVIKKYVHENDLRQ